MKLVCGAVAHKFQPKVSTCNCGLTINYFRACSRRWHPYQTELYGTYMDHVWIWYRIVYGPYVGFTWVCYGTLTSIWNTYLCLSCLSIVFSMGIKDTYFVKIDTIPIYGINMRYGNGMGAELKPIYGKDMGYGNSMGAPYQSLIYGKATYFVKIHTLPICWIGMANRPTSNPYCLIHIPWTMENLWNCVRHTFIHSQPTS